MWVAFALCKSRSKNDSVDNANNDLTLWRFPAEVYRRFASWFVCHSGSGPLRKDPVWPRNEVQMWEELTKLLSCEWNKDRTTSRSVPSHPYRHFGSRSFRTCFDLTSGKSWRQEERRKLLLSKGNEKNLAIISSKKGVKNLNSGRYIFIYKLGHIM